MARRTPLLLADTCHCLTSSGNKRIIRSAGNQNEKPVLVRGRRVANHWEWVGQALKAYMFAPHTHTVFVRNEDLGIRPVCVSHLLGVNFAGELTCLPQVTASTKLQR